MKKKIIVIMLATAVLISAGFVLAEEEKEKEKGQVRPRDPRTGRTVGATRERPNAQTAEGQRAMPPRQGAGMDREGMFRDQMQRRQEDHEASVSELKAILKMAEEENAPKTAEMLKKLIDKKESDYKKAQEQMEERRARMEEMMKQREEQMKERREGGAQNQTGERSRGRTTTTRTRPQRQQQQEEAEEEK